MTKFDPATWREAARQCREEARRCDRGTETDDAVRYTLETFARRFMNEASAAEALTMTSKP